MNVGDRSAMRDGTPLGQPALPALVCDAGTACGLAVARGLRAAGVPLVGLSAEPWAPTCHSRLWRSVIELGDRGDAAWLAGVREAYARFGRMVLLPADDPAVRLTARHGDELATMCDFVLPDAQTVDRLLDKIEFQEWATAHGFPVPRAVVVHSLRELRTAMATMTGPAVLKPFERTQRWLDGPWPQSVYRLDTPHDLHRLGFDPFQRIDRCLVQEWIPGRDSDVLFCLTYRDRQGKELAGHGGRKILQWPVDTGSTALAVSHHDGELHALTTRLLDAAGHVGLGSLEVRRDRRDGRLLITEPTVGRPDLQTALAAAAGTNLVAIAYRDALHLPTPPEIPRRDAIWIHETGLPRALVVAAHSRRLDVRTLLGVLRHRRTPTTTFFAPADPAPLLLEIARMAAGIVGKVTSRLRGPVRTAVEADRPRTSSGIGRAIR
jgi:predicted ATP-grasp superfamily ATP-dependent carboligase